MSKNIDPLDKLLQQHNNAVTGKTPTTPSEAGVITEPVDDTQDLVDDINYRGEEIDYGDNDLEEEIKMEEEADEARIQEAIENKHHDEATEATPAHPHDKEAQMRDVDFQANKLAVVTMMINRVVAKYKLVEGGVSEMPIEGDVTHLTRMELQGELVDLYHRDGDVITPEFENLILKNWILPDGRDAYTAINETGSATSQTSTQDNESDKPVTKSNEPTSININIPDETRDVTVNIDGEMVDRTMDNRQINVTVTRVSAEQIQEMNIIENGDIPEHINEYDPDLNDVPVTLSASAYRCVMSSINWFNIMRFSAAMSGNDADSENKKWSIIYKHIKNVSIGEFENYEDFLKKTKYSDLNMLSWALLTASSEEQVEIELSCSKCNHDYVYKYSPRTLAHLEKNRITETYIKTHEVSLGKEAIEHWKKVTAPTAYSLGEKSKIGVEVSIPNVYKWINEKIPLMNYLYSKYNEGKPYSMADENDPGRPEFEFMWAIAQIIDSVVIYDDADAQGIRHIKQRFTDWDKIEKILDNLSHTESMILLAIVRKFSDVNASNVSFYFENVTCPKCHVKHDRLIVKDISEQLLFPISRRLELTTINLIETPSK